MKASSSLGGKREILFSELSYLGWGERAKASSLISEHSSVWLEVGPCSAKGFRFV